MFKAQSLLSMKLPKCKTASVFFVYFNSNLACHEHKIIQKLTKDMIVPTDVNVVMLTITGNDNVGMSETC